MATVKSTLQLLFALATNRVSYFLEASPGKGNTVRIGDTEFHAYALPPLQEGHSPQTLSRVLDLVQKLVRDGYRVSLVTFVTDGHVFRILLLCEAKKKVPEYLDDPLVSGMARIDSEEFNRIVRRVFQAMPTTLWILHEEI